MLAWLPVWLLLSTAPASSPAAPAAWPEHREVLEVLSEDQLDVEEAKRLFAAGKRAAGHGRWDEAIRYFAEAYRYSGSPGQLYSLGRGHRELYIHDGRDPVQLRLALLRFEQYLEQSPEGRNRDNARRYIEQLRPYVAALEGFEQPVVITRLMVYGPVDGAMISIDGGSPRASPLAIDVEPGLHRVRMTAEGYRDAVRRVEIPAGTTVALELELDERPARLAINGPTGAELYVDGQRRERLPLERPLTLPAGRYQIAVAQAGRTSYVRAMRLARGSTHLVHAELPLTIQRRVAIAAMGASGGASIAAATLTGLAVRRQSLAAQIDRERREQGISEERYAEGRNAEQQRNALRSAAIATGVAGIVAAGVGVVLYLTDRPRLDDRRVAARRGAGRSRSRVAAPGAGPGWAGATARWRF